MMTSESAWTSRSLLVLGSALFLSAGLPAQQPQPDKLTSDHVKYQVTGPYTHDNLTVFLIHGGDRVKGKSFLTLGDALEQKKVVLHETQQVNQLAIENVSGTEEVFVQAGDIVKGGQQDRVIAFDLIVPAKSGKMPIASFCVEAGRWTRRGAESVIRFDANTAQAPTKDLKIAVRKSMEQRSVWENVAKAQMQLGDNLKTPVHAAASVTSLQLTLENSKLKEATDAYVKKLLPIVEGKTDVIGFAFAVNGQVNSADVYASHSLFQKFWPILLKGSAVEAIAQGEKGKKYTAITGEKVQAFLADAEKGTAKSKDITKRVRLIERETKDILFFECRDIAEPAAAPIRQSFLKK
jgi:hypothetical protein